MIIYSICKVFILWRDLKQTEAIFIENGRQIFSLFFPDITAPSFIFYSLEQNVDKETNASEALRTLQHFLCIIFNNFTDLFKKKKSLP